MSDTCDLDLNQVNCLDEHDESMNFCQCLKPPIQLLYVFSWCVCFGQCPAYKCYQRKISRDGGGGSRAPPFCIKQNPTIETTFYLPKLKKKYIYIKMCVVEDLRPPKLVQFCSHPFNFLYPPRSLFYVVICSFYFFSII